LRKAEEDGTNETRTIFVHDSKVGPDTTAPTSFPWFFNAGIGLAIVPRTVAVIDRKARLLFPHFVLID
jgi:hypothetical protein